MAPTHFSLKNHHTSISTLPKRLLKSHRACLSSSLNGLPYYTLLYSFSQSFFAFFATGTLFLGAVTVFFDVAWEAVVLD